MTNDLILLIPQNSDFNLELPFPIYIIGFRTVLDRETKKTRVYIKVVT